MLHFTQHRINVFDLNSITLDELDTEYAKMVLHHDALLTVVIDKDKVAVVGLALNTITLSAFPF